MIISSSPPSHNCDFHNLGSAVPIETIADELQRSHLATKWRRETGLKPRRLRGAAGSIPAQKFKTRYVTLGFSDKANLDQGHMWPTAFALKDLTEAEEAQIEALVKKAVS
jgi:hypothetical protein